MAFKMSNVMEDLEKLGTFTDDLETQERPKPVLSELTQAPSSNSLDERSARMAEGLDRATECLDGILQAMQDFRAEMLEMRKLWGVPAEEVDLPESEDDDAEV